MLVLSVSDPHPLYFLLHAAGPLSVRLYLRLPPACVSSQCQTTPYTPSCILILSVSDYPLDSLLHTGPLSVRLPLRLPPAYWSSQCQTTPQTPSCKLVLSVLDHQSLDSLLHTGHLSLTPALYSLLHTCHLNVRPPPLILPPAYWFSQCQTTTPLYTILII